MKDLNYENRQRVIGEYDEYRFGQLSQQIVEVVPTQATRKMLVTREIDNIDDDISSTTAAPDSVLHDT